MSQRQPRHSGPPPDDHTNFGDADDAVWEIVERLDEGDPAAAARLLRRIHPADQADALAALSPAERRRLLDRIDSHTLGDLLPFLTPEELEQVAPDVALPQLAAALRRRPRPSLAPTSSTPSLKPTPKSSWTASPTPTSSNPCSPTPTTARAASWRPN